MNEESLFAAAIAKSPAERKAFLDESCRGNAELRAAVEELLSASNAAGSFFEHPPAGLDVTVDAAALDTHKPANWDGSLAFLKLCHRPGRIGMLVGNAGEYEIIEVVGSGGMGIVLRAFDTKLSRVVAVKVLAPELARNPIAVKRFLREAKAAAAVVHDHVVTIHNVEETHQPPFLVMQFVDGQTLQQKIDRAGALELKEILRIGAQAAAGLAAAHKHGLVHRDVKPANILLENGVERVKLTDFGLARAADDVEITQTGLIAGTPQYMSPEQANGEPLDARSDLFSLGSVLYTMCTGRPAFRAESTMGVIRRVCDDEPRPVREVNLEIPAWLEQIVSKLLAKNPGDRYQTAAEVSELLGQCLAHVQNPAHAPLAAVLAATASGVAVHRTTTASSEEAAEKASFSALLARHPVLVAIVAISIVTLEIAVLIQRPVIGPLGMVLLALGVGIFAYLISVVCARLLSVQDKPTPPAKETKPLAMQVGRKPATPAQRPSLLLPLSLVFVPLLLFATAWLVWMVNGMPRWILPMGAIQAVLSILIGLILLIMRLGAPPTTGKQPLGMPVGRNRGIAFAPLVLLGVGLAFVGLAAMGIVSSIAWHFYAAREDEATMTLVVANPAVEVTLNGERVAVTDEGKATIEVAPGTYHIQTIVRGVPARADITSLGRGGQEMRRIREDAGAVYIEGPLSSEEVLRRLAQSGGTSAENSIPVGSSADLLTSDDWEWTTPENLGPVINSPYDEQAATLSANGLTMVFDSDRPGGQGARDLWSSTRPSLSAPWSEPVNLGPTINSQLVDGVPCLSADGLLLLFHSYNRPGGRGLHDIWVCTRNSNVEPWSEPVNVGPRINSVDSDECPALSHDGRTLIFQSSRPGAHATSDDLWVSSRASLAAEWSEAVSLGNEINGWGQELYPCLAADGLTLLFRARPQTHIDAFFMSTRPSISSTWSKPVRLSSAVQSTWTGRGLRLSPDHRTLVFGATRPGGQGGADLWFSRWARKGSSDDGKGDWMPLVVRNDPVRPALGDASALPGTSIAGNWVSNWGPVTLDHEPIVDQKPVAVRGSWRGNESHGQITTAVFDPAKATVLLSYLDESDQRKGTAELHVLFGGQVINGVWEDESGLVGGWTLWKKGAEAADPKARSIAGRWASNWGEVTIEHDPIVGSDEIMVRGSYAARGGVTKTLNNARFDPVTGVLRLNTNDDGHVGFSQFALSPNGNQLAGVWANAAGQRGTWTMTRLLQAGGAGDDPTSIWGPVYDGCQVGVGFTGGRRRYAPGEKVELELKIRNTTDAERTIEINRPQEAYTTYPGGGELTVRILGRDKTKLTFAPRQEWVISLTPDPSGQSAAPFPQDQLTAAAKSAQISTAGLTKGFYRVRLMTSLAGQRQELADEAFGFSLDGPEPAAAQPAGASNKEPLVHRDYPDVAWGTPVLGLSLGIGATKAENSKEGELTVYLWNTTQSAVPVQHIASHALDWQLALRDTQGRQIRSVGILTGPKMLTRTSLESGQAVALGKATLDRQWTLDGTPHARLSAGTYQVSTNFDCRRADLGHFHLRLNSGEGSVEVK